MEGVVGCVLGGAHIKIMLSLQWKNAFSALDLSTFTVDTLYLIMDRKLNVTHTPLKGSVAWLSNLKRINMKTIFDFFTVYSDTSLLEGLAQE